MTQVWAYTNQKGDPWFQMESGYSRATASGNNGDGSTGADALVNNLPPLFCVSGEQKLQTTLVISLGSSESLPSRFRDNMLA